MKTMCYTRKTHVEQIKKGIHEMMITEKNGRKRARFTVSAKPGSLVFVAGTFNDWDPSANQMHDPTGKGNYRADVLIPHGEYEYKFIVNGQWEADPHCHNRVADSFGSENCVLQIAKPEFKESKPGYAGDIYGKFEKSKDEK